MGPLDDRVFESTEFGVLALKYFGEVPEDFRLFSAGWIGKHPNYHGMEVKGAEFRRAKTGPRKGQLSIKLPWTERTAYVSKKDIQRLKEEKGAA